MKNLVIIPTYNEVENAEKIIRAVLGLPEGFEILIIDDGSPDGTAQVVKGLQAEFEGRLHLLERCGKQGLGTAYLTGFKWALQRGYDYVFEMDADFSHAPSDLPRPPARSRRNTRNNRCCYGRNEKVQGGAKQTLKESTTR